ncbi:MAG: hypothetical protein IKA71_02740 [Lentisphaeria bacterium]|nr:hypothetical protein [Lentisphaeria bacterium]
MLGNFIKSALDISNLLWEVVGVCLVPALLYFGYCSKKYWRSAWWYVAVFMVLFAWGWRIYIGTNSTRYYMILVLPAMMVIFHLAWDGLKHWKKLSCITLLILFAVCIARDLRYNPQISGELSLYKSIGQDAGRYKQPLVIVYKESSSQIEYYSGVKTVGCQYYTDELDRVYEGLQNNLNVYHGLCDVLYICIPITKKYRNLDEKLKTLMPDGSVEIFGRSFMDRKNKKELLVLKYIPRKEKFDSSRVPYLINGDFSQLLSGDALRKKQEYFGRRAPRFISEKPSLPKNWEIYISLITRCNSLANVEKRGDKNVLRLQAHGSYVALISQYFEDKNPCVVYFKLKANSDSFVELLRQYYHPGIMIATMPLNLPAGKETEIKWHIPSEHNKKLRRIWIQLNSGDIEISDVKVQERNF